MIQAPKHSVINAILLGRSGWRQNALATHLQHLFQKVTVFAEAYLGFFTSVFHHGAARGDTSPSHHLFHGFLEVCNCFGPAFVHLRLQITSQEKVRWGQSRGARTPLNAHCLGNQTVLEVVPEPDLVSVAHWGDVPLCWNHLVCSRFGAGRQRLSRPPQNPEGPRCVNRHSLPVVAIRPYGTANALAR